jgi:hypothetical protein
LEIDNGPNLYSPISDFRGATIATRNPSRDKIW